MEKHNNKTSEENYKQWHRISNTHPYGDFLLKYITFINYYKEKFDLKKDREVIDKVLEDRTAEALLEIMRWFGKSYRGRDEKTLKMFNAYENIVNSMDLINIDFTYNDKDWSKNKTTLLDVGIYDFKERWKDHFNWMSQQERIQYDHHVEVILEYCMQMLYYSRCDLVHGTLNEPEKENTQILFRSFNVLLDLLLEDMTQVGR